MKPLQKGKTYKHEYTGEIIYVVATNVTNHFDGCKVYVYESSLAPLEYHFLPVDSEHVNFFVIADLQELQQWHANYKVNSYTPPIYDMLNRFRKNHEEE